MPIIPARQELETWKIKARLGKISETSISTNNLSKVVHICHASYVGGISRNITVQSRPWAKDTRPHLKNN
jgi:hypothetical protein